MRRKRKKGNSKLKSYLLKGAGYGAGLGLAGGIAGASLSPGGLRSLGAAQGLAIGTGLGATLGMIGYGATGDILEYNPVLKPFRPVARARQRLQKKMRRRRR